MPYYQWRGVELTGDVKKGRLFARSLEHLDALLFKREIALLSAWEVKARLVRPMLARDVADFFQRLHVLIDAGVSVPDSIGLVADQLVHPRFQERIYQMQRHVVEGLSLSQVMEKDSSLFPPLVTQLVAAGEESGNLSQSLEGICEYYESNRQFYQRVRSALTVPLITIVFFIAIIGIIFTVIMPRFIEIFASFNQELPAGTQKLLAISRFIMSRSMILLILALVICLYSIWRFAKTKYGRRIQDICLIYTPLVGTLQQKRFLAHSLQALSLLLNGGIPLSRAIKLLRDSTTHTVFSEHLGHLEQDVLAGSSLSDAMTRHPNQIFSPDSIAMIHIAEQSGRLAPLLRTTAHTYHEQVIQILSTITLWIQPLIMIMLGLLVGFLVYAVYSPIMQMSALF